MAARGVRCVLEGKERSMGEERFDVGGGVREPRDSAGEGEVYKQSTILELQQKCRFTIVVECSVCCANEQL